MEKKGGGNYPHTFSLRIWSPFSFLSILTSAPITRHNTIISWQGEPGQVNAVTDNRWQGYTEYRSCIYCLLETKTYDLPNFLHFNYTLPSHIHLLPCSETNKGNKGHDNFYPFRFGSISHPTHTQALHTYRINLSPFTKDFRVWGAPIETYPISLTVAFG